MASSIYATPVCQHTTSSCPPGPRKMQNKTRSRVAEHIYRMSTGDFDKAIDVFGLERVITKVSRDLSSIKKEIQVHRINAVEGVDLKLLAEKVNKVMPVIIELSTTIKILRKKNRRIKRKNSGN